VRRSVPIGLDEVEVGPRSLWRCPREVRVCVGEDACGRVRSAERCAEPARALRRRCCSTTTGKLDRRFSKSKATPPESTLPLA